MKIKSSDEVIVTAPRFMPKFMINNFIEKNSSWIDKKLKNYPKKKVYNFVEGEEFFYLATPYTLKIYHTKKEEVIIDDKYIHLHTKKPDDSIHIEKKLTLWYKQKAQDIFTKIIKDYEIILDKKVTTIRVRKMTTRWGSCNTKKAYINLNLELIKKPLDSVEYVILHELAHLTHPNHSRDFHAYVERFMPDWKERRKGLERI